MNLSAPSNSNELVEAGKRELYTQNPKSAVASLTKAIDLNPTLFEAFYFRALAKQILRQLAQQQGQFEEVLTLQANAFDDVSECIRLNPDYVDAYLLRSDLYIGFNYQFDNAKDDLRMALNLVPNSVTALLKLAQIFLHPFAQDSQEALRLVSRAISIDPSNDSAIRMRFQLHKNLGQRKEAVEDLGLLIAKDPTNATLYCDRAELREQLHECQGALADLDRACQISDEWKMYRGQFHMLHRQFDLAEKDLLQAIETMEPQFRHMPIMRLTAMYVGLRKFDKALKLVNALLELGPETMMSSYYSVRSHILLELGDDGNALADCNRVLTGVEEEARMGSWGSDNLENNLSYKADKAKALIKRGAIYSRKQEKALANKDFDAAFKLISSPHDYESIGRLGETLMSIGNYQASAQMFSDIIKANPNSDKAFFHRGTAYMKTNMSDNAIQDFSECIRLNPQHADALNARAALYDLKGRKDLAAADRKIASDPDLQFHFLPEEFDEWKLFH